MYKFLNKDQRQELLDELQIERSKRYADRIVSYFFLDDKSDVQRFSKFLFLDEGSIQKIYKTVIWKSWRSRDSWFY
ncbi:MAG: hypothetical protein HOP07_00005 [Bacteriovoracaceae bacterium]|nr:hypothetical protein [Bacteriovoracaceae bacterium]